jgi:hypothetical protein
MVSKHTHSSLYLILLFSSAFHFLYFFPLASISREWNDNVYRTFRQIDKIYKIEHNQIDKIDKIDHNQIDKIDKLKSNKIAK